MIKRCRSFSDILSCPPIIKKNCSFHDFNTLTLQGNVQYKSYGYFLHKHPNSTRQQRLQAIKLFYINKI